MKFLKPKTILEAINMLEDFGSEASIMAGGTDLMPKINSRELKPKVLISINKIQQLDYIQETDGGLLIGPMTTHSRLVNSLLIREKANSLSMASAQVGSPLIRNIGTIGGNLCWASPAADTAPPLLSLGAEIIWREGSIEHKTPLESFFKGVNGTCLLSTGLVTGIFIPSPPSGTKTIFLKLGLRNAVTISVVSVAVAIVLEGDLIAKSVKIALGSVAPTPLLATAAEGFLIGKKVSIENITLAAQIVADSTLPISDVRASAWYRKEMARIYTIRALSAIAGLKEV
jgi:carbon-monoxide dehydrogenase medium subunit